jgi:aryl-alcohol dehydrogenase-like predicted oxidoreductase
VALAWLLSRPAVTAPIIGPRTMEQLEAALVVLDHKLTKSEMDRLDEICPGYLPSPEAFAW